MPSISNEQQQWSQKKTASGLSSDWHTTNQKLDRVPDRFHVKCIWYVSSFFVHLPRPSILLWICFPLVSALRFVFVCSAARVLYCEEEVSSEC